MRVILLRATISFFSITIESTKNNNLAKFIMMSGFCSKNAFFHWGVLTPNKTV